MMEVFCGFDIYEYPSCDIVQDDTLRGAVVAHIPW